MSPEATTLASPEQVAAAIASVTGELAAPPDPQAAQGLVSAALADLAAAHPELAGLDRLQLARLVSTALDPDGERWMADAGLLATDSCGYPVTGGLYDVKSDLSATPQAQAAPEVADTVLAQLRRQWADSYILTGNAPLDLPWRTYLPR